jgi:hypothetical protein
MPQTPVPPGSAMPCSRQGIVAMVASLGEHDKRRLNLSNPKTPWSSTESSSFLRSRRGNRVETTHFDRLSSVLVRRYGLFF